MKMTDLRAKARAIFGPAFAEPMPNQPNGAKALQQRANARPIPTYKVGGPVKKPMPTPADLAAAKAQNEMIKKATVSKKEAAAIAAGNNASALTGAEMRKMKMKTGGKVQTSSDTARKLASEMGGMKKGGKVKPVELDMKMLEEASRPRASLPNLESKVAEARNLNTVRAKETSDAAKGKSFKEAFAEARRDQGPNGVFTWRGNTYNTKMAGETSKAAPTRAAAPAAATPPARAATPTPTPTPTPAATPPAASANKSSNTGSSMSSVARNLDTRSSIDAGALEARAKKIMAESGGSLFSSPKNKQQALEIARAEDEDRRNMSRYRGEQERKKQSLAAGRKANPDLVSRFVDMTMNPGYKKGGKVKEPKPKNGLAVMIAIGKPMKPAKKMNGGPMAAGSMDREASKVTREMAMGGDPMGYMGGGSPMGYAAGGAGKTRKGQAPIKKAQGGAAKVRKGMMTPEGDIINVMNKMRGK
jgi:hypothetical protein